MHRRALTATLSGVALALSGTLAGIGSAGTAQAEESVSPLVLGAPDRVVARTYGRRVYTDFGIRVTAQGEAFELRANRPTYDDPIQTVWHRETLADVTLPAGSMSTWEGLDNFARIAVLQDGKRLRNIRTVGCFNGEATKVGPEGPASNPYPWGCPWNPYTLGSVMGVAQDYAGSLFPAWGGAGMRLKPGTYDVVAAIRPRWRNVFGISAEDATTTTRLVVKERRRNWRPVARRATTPADAAGGGSTLEATTSAPTADSEGVLENEFAPDLRSLPAFDISISEKGNAIRFGATVWNGGHGPMVIEGFPEEHEHARTGPGEHTRHMTAYQYYFDGDGHQTGYDQVGEFAYHEANHNHWHFEDFARYRLLQADEAGQPTTDVAVRSTKASFCLVATDAVDYTVPNADWRPEYTDLSSDCGGRRAQSLREVLSNGSGDTYHQFRAGQAFRVGNLPDGVYYISVEANPDDRANGRNLKELDYSNNDSLRKITLRTNRRGQRTVRAAQVGIIEEFSFGGFFRR